MGGCRGCEGKDKARVSLAAGCTLRLRRGGRLKGAQVYEWSRGLLKAAGTVVYLMAEIMMALNEG